MTPSPTASPVPAPSPVAPDTFLVRFVRMTRARRYRLTLGRDGSFRCTVPAHGSLKEAEAFVRRSTAWMSERLQARANHPKSPQEWLPGSIVFLRGTPETIGFTPDASALLLGTLQIPLPPTGTMDLRPHITAHLRHLATLQLPNRTRELADLHGYAPKAVQVRNQSSRWGSCSARGRISLNWRLIQTPDAVRDYIILHELAHLRHLNHSTRFWAEVERLCPDFPTSEAWLKSHGPLLM